MQSPIPIGQKLTENAVILDRTTAKRGEKIAFLAILSVLQFALEVMARIEDPLNYSFHLFSRSQSPLPNFHWNCAKKGVFDEFHQWNEEERWRVWNGYQWIDCTSHVDKEEPTIVW